MGRDMAADTLSRQAPSRSSRLRGALTPDEWLRLGSMFAVIVALHVIGWGTLVLVVEPAHLSVGDKAFGIGIGLTAYTLGLRHAFDADHIAAIDNTTRKLMNDGQRPLGVGFFFSLGHSSVVFGLSLLDRGRAQGNSRAGRAGFVGPASLHQLDRHQRLGRVPVS